MPTIRGFVERLEVGRAGLAMASLLHDDGTRADYQLPDLDADPERFNERLSKLGLLRDAMSRAEPVEIEFRADAEGGGLQIDRVARITRDMLAGNLQTIRATVFIVGIGLLADNRSGARAEAGDAVSVVTMTPAGTVAALMLDMQLPERAVALMLLQLLRDAQAAGQPVTLVVDAKNRRIVGVESGGAPAATDPSGSGEIVDGFVETVVVAPSLAPMSNLAMVEFTTAPPFGAAGNVVPLLAFTPTLTSFLVVQGSAEYDLFVAGLRDKLRMRVMLGARIAAPTRNPTSDPQQPQDKVTDADRKLDEARSSLNRLFKAMPAPAPAAAPGQAEASAKDGAKDSAKDSLHLVRATQLVAALASASRPVWVRIARQSLDQGPDGEACTDGLPSSDLSPQSLRDLRLPYTAEWTGWGCFNHGVYRLQFELGVEFEAYVDGKLVCLHASDDGKLRFAHACLHDEHEIRVVLKRWTCAQTFRMDVYRIR